MTETPTFPGCFAIIVMVLCALALVLTPGCGAQLTDAQHVSLATRTQQCLVTEREIVDRPGTTAEQDAADLATARAECDRDRAAIVGAP